MPRVSRFITEFEANGRLWIAEFSHQHARELCPHGMASGHTIFVCRHFDEKGRPLHRTHCPSPQERIRCPEPKREWVFYDIAPGKQINVQHLTTLRLRNKGSDGKLSPVIVVGKAPCSIRDVYNWRKGLHFALQRALEKAGYCKLGKDAKGRILVVDRKPIYSEVCEAFWREMGRRAVAPKTSMAPAVDPQEYTGQVHGLGWTGD